MSTETTNKKIKIDNGTTFGRTYTDKAVDERLQGLVSTATFTPVQEKANNSLQKPAGLTKTELVGVGTNGQENIEIGDNLTLANGKLSATGGGGSGVKTIVAQLKTPEEKIDGGFVVTFQNTEHFTNIFNVELEFFHSYAVFQMMCTTDGVWTGVAYSIGRSGNEIAKDIYSLEIDDYDETIPTSGILRLISISNYSHFITLTNDNEKIYLQFECSSGETFDMNALKTALSGRKVLATGVLGNSDETKADPKFVSGEAGGLEVYYAIQNDTSGTITSKSITSFAISDLVSDLSSQLYI